MRPTILIVDDERDKAKSIWGQVLIDDYGWDVDYAGGYAEAIEYLNRSPQPAVILLDRQMPDPVTGQLRKEVGDELLEKVVVDWPDVCPIMFTNNADAQSAKTDTRNGAFEYYDKSVPHYVLDRACRLGIEWVRIKRSRIEFYDCQSTENVCETAFRVVNRDERPKYVAYVESAPGGAVFTRFQACVAAEGFSLQSSDRCFLNASQMDSIGGNRRSPHWISAERLPPGQCMAIGACSRLVVPILRVESQKGSEPTEWLWFESPEMNAYDRRSSEAMEFLANFVDEALERVRRSEEVKIDTSNLARRWLIANAAAEICGPLQTAQSQLELVVSQSKDAMSIECGRQFQPMLLQLRSVAHSLEQAVQAIVELRHDLPKAVAERKPVNLAELVLARKEAMEARCAQNNIVITFNPPQNVPPLSLDPVEMRYAIDCLLENAIEAIQQKRLDEEQPEMTGEIRFKVDMDPSCQRAVLLSVVDNGCGFRFKKQTTDGKKLYVDTLPKVFDQYFTTKELVRRDGHRSMGLSQVKRLIELFGGEIEAARAPKGGAEFTILLPVKPATPATLS